MSSEQKLKEARPRKPKARNYAIVFGAIEERLSVLMDVDGYDAAHVHVSRIIELMDELKRSISKDNVDE